MMAGLKTWMLVIILISEKENWLNETIYVKTQKISEKQLQIDPINNNVSDKSRITYSYQAILNKKSYLNLNLDRLAQ